MASNTPNFNLYKKDPVLDGDDTFNIATMLNENWDKIDLLIKQALDQRLLLTGGTLTGALKIKNNSPIVELEETDTGKKFYLVVDGSTISIREDSLAGTSVLNFDGATNVLSTLGNKIWHEGNDGAGSGLDADTLDGKQATEFSPNTLKGSLTVTNASWVSGSYGGGMNYRKAVAISGVVLADTVGFYPTLATKQIAEDANVSHLESYNGGVYLYSESIPSDSITFDYRVIRG